MRTLLVGLLAANGMVLGEAESVAAQARGRSVERASYKQNASTAPDRYRGSQLSRSYDNDTWDDWEDDRQYEDGWDGGRNRIEYVGVGRARGSRAYGRVRVTGPAFCVSGRGHPVFGWRWCLDRGHVTRASARGPTYRIGEPIRWSVVRWGDIYLRHDYPDRAYRKPHKVNVKKVVGRQVRDRLRYHRDRLGLRGSLDGRWIRTGRYGLVLQVRAGGRPVAELVDYDGDAHVDRVALSRYRY